MKGQILHLDEATGEGVIRGKDGRRYAVAAVDLRGAGEVAHAGVAVDFEPAGDRAAADRAHALWRKAVERAKGWAD